MIISHKYKFIFVKTRKTAGTSIEAFLSPHCGPDDVLTPLRPPEAGHQARHYQRFFNPLPELLDGGGRGIVQTVKDLVRRRAFRPHMWAREIKPRVSADVWDTYFKFCVDRNPWDKALSYYHHLIAQGRQFSSMDDYIQGADDCLNLPFYSAGDGTVIVDRVIRYERLNEELSEVFSELGVPFDGSLGVRAKGGYRSDRRPYWEVLSAEQVDAIAQRYSAEIALLGYEPRHA